MEQPKVPLVEYYDSQQQQICFRHCLTRLHHLLSQWLLQLFLVGRAHSQPDRLSKCTWHLGRLFLPLRAEGLDVQTHHYPHQQSGRAHKNLSHQVQHRWKPDSPRLGRFHLHQWLCHVVNQDCHARVDRELEEHLRQRV